MTYAPLALAALLRDDAAAAGSEAAAWVFGDAYLVRHCPPFRAIRRAALAQGATFSRDVEAYLVHPLLQLGSILESRRLPAPATTRAVEAFLAARPNATNADLARIPPQPSALMHESAHLVADRIIAAYVPAQDREARILRHLLGEAFANTAESAAFLVSYEDAKVQAFLTFNAYRRVMTPALHAAYRTAVGTIGEEATFGYLMLAHLLANFGNTTVTDEQHGLMLRLLALKPDAAVEPALRKLLAFALSLNQTFVTTTNEAWLALQGLEGPLRFCPLAMLGRDVTWQKAAETLLTQAWT